MHDRIARNLALTLFVLAATLAPAAAFATDGVTAGVEISFTGTSTLHDFHGTAATVETTLSADPPGTPDRGAERWSGAVSIAVATLDTGSKRRDAGMRAMLHAERCPNIEGAFRAIDPEAVAGGGVLPFELEICGVRRSIDAKITEWRRSEDEASFIAEFDVSLEAFELAAPGVLFLKVGDLVHVRAAATVQRSPAGSRP